VSHINDLLNRISDELESSVFLKLDISDKQRYLYPTESWDKILDRFGDSITVDVEEAGKSLALGRNTACVFHLMRVTECAVLDFRNFSISPTPKRSLGRF